MHDRVFAVYGNGLLIKRLVWLSHFSIAGHVKVTVRGVRLHGRRERALGDGARIKDQYRYEVGSGSERRVMPIRSLPVKLKEEWSETGIPS